MIGLILSAVALSSGAGANGSANRHQPSIASSSAIAIAQDSVTSARQWLALVDTGQWTRTWEAAGTLFKSRASQSQWTSKVQPLRQAFGPVESRTLMSATKTTSLPGVPDGEYAIVRFHTVFAHKKDAVETVILARQGTDWKVDGYFIR